MKTTAWVGLAVLLLGSQAQAQGTSQFFGGLRLHRESSVLPHLPYDKNDLSATVAWEYHENVAFWQLALDYGWDPSGSPAAGSVLTPQVNLIFEDRGVLGGVGILRSYIDDDERGSKWTNIYYQFLLGFGGPVGRVHAAVYAIYPFRNWRELDEFKGRDIEYLAGIVLPF